MSPPRVLPGSRFPAGLRHRMAFQLDQPAAADHHTALGTRNEENRQAVLRAAGSLGKLPAEDYVHEELAWRLEA